MLVVLLNELEHPLIKWLRQLFSLQIANFATDLQYQQAHEQDFYGQRHELRGLRSARRQGHTKSGWRERGERQPVDEPSTGGF